VSGAGPAQAGAEFASRGETYRLAVLQGEEIGMLAPLLRQVFGERGFSPEWLERKYAWARNGTRAFACAALAADGEPAAAVGVLPWPFRHGERTELAAQIGDSSTAPAHRGRGLFVRLVQYAHEVCDAAGVAFVIRFPNENSFPITVSKLGYTHLGDLVEFRQPLKTIWAERATGRVRLAGSYDRYVARVLRDSTEESPSTLSSPLAEGHAGVDRDPAFLAYKAAFGGSRVLSLDGARAWLTVRHGALIGDVEASSDAEIASGLDALSRLGRRLGVHRLLFQASEDLRFSRALATRLPEAGRRPVAYFDLRSRIPADALRFTMGDIDTF
jgi:GNAT superfamily N-acetyltransferase